MSEPDRDEGGRFSSKHGDREYLEVVGSLEPAGTKDVADALGVSRQNAHARLRRLETEGLVTRTKIGNSLAWSLDEKHLDSRPVNPDDEFWDAETYEGEEMSAADVDSVLYGETTAE